ncbi:VCBS repeat-containing protein, partial [bacterium]|nr:VCBS repeat-containing protein [bacterium]
TVISISISANTVVMDIGKIQHEVAAVDGDAKPVYYDLDRDGKKDLISGCGSGKIKIYKNYGTTSHPIFNSYTFAFLTNDIIIDLSGKSLPDITDWNGDNLPDLIVGTYKAVYIFTNCTVTAGVAPAFAEAGKLHSLGGTTNIVYGDGNLSVKIVSYDGTSSNDLLVGENNSSTPKVVTYYKNIGTYSIPVLTNMGAVKSPSGSELSFSFGPSPLFFDWNNDGTNELIVSDISFIKVYETTNYPPAWIEKTSFVLSPKMSYYKLESCGDINADGKKDLLVGSFTGGLFWLTNGGTLAEAAFSAYRPVKAGRTNIIFGTTSCTVNIWDFNGDGLWDITLRRPFSSNLRMYPNLGNINLPILKWFEVGKLDNGMFDRFYSYNSNQYKYTSAAGTIGLYTNAGSYSSPVFLKYQSLKEGTDDIPYIYNHTGLDVCDMNGDGKLDLWYFFYGTNYWFENTNNNLTPIYKQREIAVDNNNNQLIFTESMSIPKMTDWDNDGKLDILFANKGGKIKYYKNISNFPPVYVSQGYLETISEGEIYFGNSPYNFDVRDVNNNGLQDLFIGFYDGTTRGFEATPEPLLFMNCYLLLFIYYFKTRKKV